MNNMSCTDKAAVAVYGILSLINITLVGILLKGGKTNQVGWVWMMYAFAIMFTLGVLFLVFHDGGKIGSVALGGMVASVFLFEIVIAINHGVGNFSEFNKTSLVGMHMFEIALFGAMCAVAAGVTCSRGGVAGVKAMEMRALGNVGGLRRY